MPILLLWQGISWLGTFGTILKKVPWQVWAVIGAVIAVLYYGHVREARGYARCQAAVKIATDHEVARQSEVSQNAIRDALKRAADASAREQEANNERDKLQQDVDKLKEAGQKCLPGTITNRYRR